MSTISFIIMSPRRRLIVFTVFALLFIVVTPFLVFFSLGLNFKEGKVVRTLSINTQTFPTGAQVDFLGDEIGSTPREFQATAGQMINLNISKSGFLDESFRFWSPEDRSGTARLTNVWLLPEEVDNTDTLDEDTTLLGFLPKSQVLLKKDSSYYISTFNASGLSNDRQKVNAPKELDILSGDWDLLPEEGFWNFEQKLLMLLVDEEWRVFDLSQLPVSIVDLTLIEGDNFLLRDDQNILWTYSPGEQLEYVADDVYGVFRMQLPSSVWIWQHDEIFRINQFESVEDFDLTEPVLTDLDLLDPVEINNKQSIKAIPLNQGIVLRAGNLVWYIPDLNQPPIQLINDAFEIGSDGEVLFWVDSQRSLNSINLLLQRQRYYGTLDIDLENKVELFYYFDWRRIMVYSDDKVYSAWIEKDFANDYIMQYDAQEWLNLNCMNEVINRIQFCLNDNTFFVYKNARWLL